MTYKLYASLGCGSMLVEAAFAKAALPLKVVDIDWDDTGWANDNKGGAKLKALNPLGQVPVLVLPDGDVMTESAAILMHIAEIAPQAALAPTLGDPTRPQFLRWLQFLVSAVYPTFTYGDRPERWLPGHHDAGEALTNANIEHRKTLYWHMEAHAGAPYFLGANASLIDIYLWAMNHWRPRQDWFAAETPKLHAIAETMRKAPWIASVAKRNGI
jgi:GST-like protein